jgi:hypothetical protein
LVGGCCANFNMPGRTGVMKLIKRDYTSERNRGGCPGLSRERELHARGGAAGRDWDRLVRLLRMDRR